MSLTLYMLEQSLKEVFEQLNHKIEYDKALMCFQNKELSKLTQALIDRCEELINTGVISNIAGDTLTLFDVVRFQSISNSANPIKVQLNHYGAWVDTPNAKVTLVDVNVLFDRTRKRYTMADSILLHTIVTVALKEQFYCEKPYAFPQSIINRKLNKKIQDQSFIDYELYEFLEQKPLINTVTDLLLKLLHSRYKQRGLDLHQKVVEVAESIKTGFLNILDQDMVNLLSILPEPANITNFYENYHKFYQHKDSLAKWAIESKQKLLYVLLNTEQGLSISDDSYFSYSNLLDFNAQRTFLDKVSVRRVFQSDISIVKQLLSSTMRNYRNYPSFFSVWSFWLGHTKHENINPHVFETLTSIRLHEQFIKTSPEHIKIMLKHGVHLIDILYEFLLEQFNLYASYGESSKTFKESIVFNDLGYFIDMFLHDELREQRGRINTILNEIADYVLFTRNTVSTPDCFHPHLSRINSSTSFKGLSRKAHQWHLEVQKHNMGPLSVWTQFKPFSEVIEGYTFTLLTDNHQLFNEGLGMTHCVNTFDGQITSNLYVVFSIKGADEAGTLGLALNKNSTGESFLTIDQVRGPYNASVSNNIHAAANILVTKLNNHPELIYSAGRFPTSEFNNS